MGLLGSVPAILYRHRSEQPVNWDCVAQGQGLGSVLMDRFWLLLPSRDTYPQGHCPVQPSLCPSPSPRPKSSHAGQTGDGLLAPIRGIAGCCCCLHQPNTYPANSDVFGSLRTTLLWERKVAMQSGRVNCC